MGLREVKKELELLEKEELVYHISELYKKYKEVKEYFDFYSNPDEQAIIEKFKERIHEGFYPIRGKNLKLYRARKAINEMKKLGISAEADGELLLYFAEVGVKYAREKRVKTEAYYIRLENSFQKALEHLQKHDLLEKYEPRCKEIVERSARFPYRANEHIEQSFQSFY